MPLALPPLSPETAIQLLNSQNISPETYESILRQNQAVGAPPGQPPGGPPAPATGGVASNVGSFLNKINPVTDIIKSVGNTLDQSGRFTSQDATQLPAFDPTQQQTRATKEALPGAASSALQSAKEAGSTEEQILTPAAKKSAEQIFSQTELGQLNAQARTDEAWKNFQGDQQKARQMFDELAQKAKINPNRYLESMGVGQKLLTGFALALGGMGAGITGGPNRASDFLNMQIKNDIQAQKDTIESQILLLARQSGLAASDINAGQISAISQNLANQLVTTGSLSALDAIKNQVQGATARSRADALIFPLQQQLINTQGQYDEITKGLISANDYQTLSLFGKYLNNFGLIPQGTSPYERVKPQITAPEKPLEPKKELAPGPVIEKNKTSPNQPKKTASFREKLQEMYEKNPTASPSPFGGFR